MGKKRLTSMRIDGEVIDKAKEIGLNISQFCENALKQGIKALEQARIQTETNGGYIDTRSVSRSAKMWTGRDLNPRPPNCEVVEETALRLSTYLERFKEFLLVDLRRSKKTACEHVRYVRGFLRSLGKDTVGREDVRRYLK